MLKIKNIYAKYDAEVNSTKAILEDINLDVNSGKIIGILGRNGVGKSTLLRVISGLLKPYSGSILFNDEEITKLDSLKRIHKGISYVAQGRECFLDLTVEENIKIALLPFQLTGTEIKQRAELALNYFKQLTENKNDLVYNLSGGIRQMLVITMAFVQAPKCILLDEPTLGLSEAALNQLKNLIHGFRNNDKSIILVEQKSQIIFDLCDYIYFMDQGKIVLSGLPNEIINSSLFRRLYVGVNNY